MDVTIDNSVNQKIQQYAFRFFIYFFLYLLVNLYVLMRPSFHWDEILDWSGQATDTYLVAGRWGCYMYRMLLGEGSFPVVAGLVAGVYISLAVLVQTHLLQLKGLLVNILYAFVYMACNQWAFQLVYGFLSDAVALGMLLSTLSVYCLVRRNGFFVPVLLLTMALSMYQSVGLYFGVLWAVVVLADKGKIMQALIRLIPVAMLGLVLYFVAQKLCMSVVSIPQDTIDYVQKYQASTTNWTSFGDNPPMLKFLCVAHYFKVSLIQALGSGEQFNILTSISLVPLLLLIVRYLLTPSAWLEKTVRVMLLGIVWYGPFALTFVLLGNPGDRANVAAPLSAACLWMLVIKEFAVPAGKQLLGLALVSVLLLKSSYANAVRARDEAHAYHSAVHQVQEIYSHARYLSAAAGVECRDVLLFAEEAPAQDERACILPNSFQTRGVLAWYARHYSLDGMRVGTPDEYQQHRAKLETLPFWPDRNSVTINNGQIVVKVAKAPIKK